MLKVASKAILKDILKVLNKHLGNYDTTDIMASIIDLAKQELTYEELNKLIKKLKDIKINEMTQDNIIITY